MRLSGSGGPPSTPGKQGFRPLEDFATDRRPIDRANGVVVLAFGQLAQTLLLLDALLAVDEDALPHQHVRRDDEADLLDLAQPFLVRLEFGGSVCHVSQ